MWRELFANEAESAGISASTPLLIVCAVTKVLMWLCTSHKMRRMHALLVTLSFSSLAVVSYIVLVVNTIWNVCELLGNKHFRVDLLLFLHVPFIPQAIYGTNYSCGWCGLYIPLPQTLYNYAIFAVFYTVVFIFAKFGLANGIGTIQQLFFTLIHQEEQRREERERIEEIKNMLMEST